MQAEGGQTVRRRAADAGVRTADAGEEAGVTDRAEHVADLAAAIPATLRDPESHWFARRGGLGYLVSKDRVKRPAMTYEELADPKWKGRVVHALRSSTRIRWR